MTQQVLPIFQAHVGRPKTPAKSVLEIVNAPLTAPTEFRLISVLVQLHREDRVAERAPENYRSISAADLGEAVSTTGEVAGRKAISRLRTKINSEFQELYGSQPGSNAIIENTPGKGYRLNPAVRVVAPDQISP